MAEHGTHTRMPSDPWTVEPEDSPRALASDGDTMADRVATGCALSDILTTLSAEGWTAFYLNQPVEIAELRPQLRDVPGLEEMPQLLLRVGRGDLPAPAPRRPVDDVLAR